MARQCIDDVAVIAPVLMIDAEARIVPPDEASTNEFGHCAAEIGLGGDANAIAHFLLEEQGGFGRITRELALALQFIADPFGERNTARVARSHRGQAVAEPVAQAVMVIAALHKRACLAVAVCGFGNQGKDHERIARTQTGLGDRMEQSRHVVAALSGRRDRSLKHTGGERSTNAESCESPVAWRMSFCQS